MEEGANYDHIVVKTAVEGEMMGVRDLTDDELVSIDFVLCETSSIFDSGADIALNNNFVKSATWYDNEWGCSHHWADLAIYMQRVDG